MTLFAGQASQEHETSHLRLTGKDSRRVEVGSRKRISDSRAQDDSAGSGLSHGELERTGSRRAIANYRLILERRDVPVNAEQLQVFCGGLFVSS